MARPCFPRRYIRCEPIELHRPVLFSSHRLPVHAFKIWVCADILHGNTFIGLMSKERRHEVGRLRGEILWGKRKVDEVGAAGGSTEWEWGWGLLLDGYVLVRVGFGRAQKHGGGQYIIRSTASSPPRPIGCNRWHRSYAPPLFSLPLFLASISPPHTPTPLLAPPSSSPPPLPSAAAFHSNRRLTHRGEHDRADGENVHKDRLGRRIAERCLPRQQLVYDHPQSPPVDIPGSHARTGRSVRKCTGV